MQLKHVSREKIYTISGADFLDALEAVAIMALEKFKEQTAPDLTGTHKLRHKEAAAYLKVSPSTLYQWCVTYNIKKEKGRNGCYPISELKRVEKERQFR